MRSTNFPKPIVLVSRCLGFDPCRYNGEEIPNDFVKQLRPFVHYVTVCPEVQIGLGVPRDPIQLERRKGRTRLIQPSTGRDLTAQMTTFADSFLSSLEDIDGVILKSRSPSCGLRDVKLYRQNGGGSIGQGPGFFGGAVLKKFPNLSVEDEARLGNRRIRDKFLTRIFLSARLRQIKKVPAGLYSTRKLLSMLFNSREISRIRDIAK